MTCMGQTPLSKVVSTEDSMEDSEEEELAPRTLKTFLICLEVEEEEGQAAGRAARGGRCRRWSQSK